MCILYVNKKKMCAINQSRPEVFQIACQSQQSYFGKAIFQGSSL